MVGKIGGLLALFGVLSSVLYLIDFNLRILMWIDNWGVTVGWGIRIAMIVIGVLLFLVGGGLGADDEEELPEEA